MQSTQPERKSDKEKLFARIRNEKVTLFIGSGFSLAAGAPSAHQIISALKNVHPDIEKNELKDVAEVTDKKRRNTAESRTEGSGRGRVCGIPQGTGLNRTAEYRREQDRNSGIPQGTGLNRTAEYRREQDRNSGIPQGTGLNRNSGIPQGTGLNRTAEYRGEQD